MMSEDMLARLRAAESEAQQLRQQLAAVQGEKVRPLAPSRPGAGQGAGQSTWTTCTCHQRAGRPRRLSLRSPQRRT
jgi:hypothetical protein